MPPELPLIWSFHASQVPIMPRHSAHVRNTAIPLGVQGASEEGSAYLPLSQMLGQMFQCDAGNRERLTAPGGKEGFSEGIPSTVRTKAWRQVGAWLAGGTVSGSPGCSFCYPWVWLGGALRGPNRQRAEAWPSSDCNVLEVAEES